MALMHWMALSLSTLVAPGTTLAPEVVWIDLAGVPGAAQEAARREAAAALEDVGLSPRWRTGAAGELIAAHELPVVLLKHDRSAPRGSSRVLGACLPRSASPRAWVYLDNLAWAMRMRAPDGPLTLEQSVRLGRAIGRIVAHEVIHAVAPALGHASQGIMSPRFDTRDLLAAHLPVDGATRRGVRAVLAAARASYVPPRS
jgi:hypothetical protein